MKLLFFAAVTLALSASVWGQTAPRPTNAAPGVPPAPMTRVQAIEYYWAAHKTNHATVRMYEKQMEGVQAQIASRQKKLQAASEKQMEAAAAGQPSVPDRRNPEIAQLNQEIAQLQKQYSAMKAQVDVLKTSFIQSINYRLPAR